MNAKLKDVAIWSGIIFFILCALIVLVGGTGAIYLGPINKYKNAGGSIIAFFLVGASALVIEIFRDNIWATLKRWTHNLRQRNPNP